MFVPKLSRDTRLLIMFSGFRHVTELFLGTFMISFLMQIASNQILSVSIYKLFEYAATCFGFFLFANWCKRHDKVNVLRLSVLPKIALLVSIIVLGDRITDYVILMGFLYGLCAGMYYLPTNAMIDEKVPSRSVGYYMGTLNAVNHAVKIIFPVVLGIFINTGSYVSVSYVLLGLTIIEALLMCLLTPSRHRSRKPIDFGGFVRCVLRFSIIKKLFALELLRGFGHGLLTSVIAIYTIYMFKTDLNLGVFTTLFSLCSVISSWCLGRFCPNKNYPFVISLCMLMTMFGVSVFIWRATPLTFLIYNFVYATAILVLDQLCKVYLFTLSKSSCVTNNHKIEFFVLRDWVLFMGRWIGYLGMMYIGVFGGYPWLRWYLGVIAFVLMLIGFLSININRSIRSR